MSTLPLSSCVFATKNWVEERACRDLGRRCERQGPSFTDLKDASVAAALCRRCPVATDCLLAALRADAAHRRGEDPIGITGVYAGVWFDPDHAPQRILGVAA